MFNFQSNIFKKFFGETWGGTRTVAEHEEHTPLSDLATIRQMKNGRYRLLSGEFGNEVVATYNRLSDAKRGAKRRGLTVA